MISKKKLKAIPVMDIGHNRKDGLIVRSQCRIFNHKKYLVLDFFMKKALMYRIFVTKNDYIYYDCKKDSFTKKNICNFLSEFISTRFEYEIVNNRYLMYEVPVNARIRYFSDDDKIKCESFFHAKMKRSLIDMIFIHQENIKKTARHKKESEAKRVVKERNATLTKAFKPDKKFITDVVFRQMQYLFLEETEKQNYNCYCTHCRKDYKWEIQNARHGRITHCKKCGFETKIQRVNCCKRIFIENEWMMVPQSTSDENICLRYVWCQRIIRKSDYRKEEWTIKELARQFIDVKKLQTEEFCLQYNDEFKKTGYPYFSTGCFGLNSMYCGYNFLHTESAVRTLTSITNYDYTEYINYANQYPKRFFYLFRDLLTGRDAIYEKMCNAKLYTVVNKLLDTSVDQINYFIDTKASSLKGILRLDNHNYRQYLKFQDNDYWNVTDCLSMFQTLSEKHIQVSDIDLWAWISNMGYSAKFLDLPCTIRKFTNYMATQIIKPTVNSKYDQFSSQKSFFEEWKHYIEVLRELEYPMDDLNMFPRNFYKSDKRVADEYAELLAKRSEELKRHQEEMMKKISDGLRNMEDIDTFMKGTNGLKVFVPESPEELVKEGKELGNCLASYVRKVSEGKTSIFFIRKMNHPDKAYYAMEYKDGKIIQLQGKGNCDDTKGNVTAFANVFCKVLNTIQYQPQKFMAA